jgi:hypothetical protein
MLFFKTKKSPPKRDALLQDEKKPAEAGFSDSLKSERT